MKKKLSTRDIQRLKELQDERSRLQRVQYAVEANQVLDSIAAISVDTGNRFIDVASTIGVNLLQLVNEAMDSPE